MTKEELEDEHLNEFFQCMGLESFNFTRNIAPEPDFTLAANQLRIGIEHTRLFYTDDRLGNNIRSHYKVADFIVNDAYVKFKKLSDIKLIVLICFTSTYGLAIEPPVMLSMKDVSDLSSFICDFVLERVPSMNESVRFNQFDFKSGTNILPPKISYVSIYNCGKEHWSKSSGGIVPTIQGYDLEDTIKKKNKKIVNYKANYDELWLLIIEDEGRHQTYYDFEDINVIETESFFDKVFIYRRGENKVYTTINSKPQE